MNYAIFIVAVCLIGLPYLATSKDLGRVLPHNNIPDPLSKRMVEPKLDLEHDPLPENHIARHDCESNISFPIDFNITYLTENAMNEIRSFMRTGNATYKIPVLEPYTFQETNLIYNDEIKLYGNFTGDLINLSSVTWSRLYACLFSMVWQIDFILQGIKLQGYYDLDGAIYDTFPLYGSGNYSFEIDMLNFTATAQFVPQTGDSPIRVNFTEVNFNSIEGTKMDFGEVLGGGTLSEIVNEFSNDISAAVIAHITGLLEVFYTGVLGHVLEHALEKKNITIPEIIDYLQSFPNATIPL